MENKATATRDALRERLMDLAPAMERSSLYLLRWIDGTVDSLQVMEQLGNANAAAINQVIRDMQAAPIILGVFLDPDDRVINKFEEMSRATEDQVTKLLMRKPSIEASEELDDTRRELLITAVDRCTGALAALIEANKDLRAAIIGRDLAAELAPSETFDSPEALIDSLRKHAT
jgi:hypothetical protein